MGWGWVPAHPTYTPLRPCPQTAPPGAPPGVVSCLLLLCSALDSGPWGAVTGLPSAPGLRWPLGPRLSGHVSGTEQNSQAEPTGPMPAKSRLGEGGSLADAALALALLWAVDLWGLQRVLERAPRERCTVHTCCRWAPIPAPRPRFPAEPQFPPL